MDIEIVNIEGGLILGPFNNTSSMFIIKASELPSHEFLVRFIVGIFPPTESGWYPHNIHATITPTSISCYYCSSQHS